MNNPLNAGKESPIIYDLPSDMTLGTDVCITIQEVDHTVAFTDMLPSLG